SSIGRCGPLRYVFYNGGFGSFEEYFAMEGNLVAARNHADYSRTPMDFGRVPSCEKVPTVRLCDDGYLDAGSALAAFTLPLSPVDVTVEQASSLLGFPLPPHATGFRMHSSGLRDTMQRMRFELPAADLAMLEKSLPCRLGPETTRAESELK